jgi:hypothetical protein
MANTTVNIAGRTATTNAAGVFTLKNAVLPVQTVVTCAPAGYFKSIHLLELKANKTAQVSLVMQTKTVLQTFSASAGATVTVGTQGATVALPANGYKDAAGNAYSGQVQVSARFVNVATPRFAAIAPGTMSATNAQGKAVQLATYGMMEVLLTTPSGDALQLNGKKATITSPIDATQSAPATIPLWYLDETTGLWKEEGVATKQGNSYTTEVAHFTWWNCASQGQSSIIKGRAMDCEGKPISNIGVWGAGYYSLTDANGYFEGKVLAGQAQNVTFDKFYGSCSTPAFSTNPVKQVPSLAAGQVYDLGTISMVCPTTILSGFKTIKGHIVGCNNQTGIVAAVTIGEKTVFADTNGDFSITQCGYAARSTPSLHVTTLDDFYTTTVTILMASTLNAGVITVCGNQSNISADNEFIINGDGYVNERVVFSNGSISTICTNNTLYWASMSNDSDDFSIQVPIANSTIATTSSIFTFSSHFQRYSFISGSATTTTTTPTYVQGVFSGTYKNVSNNAIITVTKGKFKGRR